MSVTRPCHLFMEAEGTMPHDGLLD